MSKKMMTELTKTSKIPKTSNAAMAREAREAGRDRFMAECQHHGLTEFYSAGAQCVACQAARESRRIARRQSDPEVREARNAYTRTLWTTSENHRGQQREATAARDWRKASSGTELPRRLPASHAAQRPALQALYAAVPPKHQADHVCPAVAKDYQGGHVASGLHVIGNIRAVPAKLNSMKSSYFDCEEFREQRPLNAFPGGSGDPELSEREWARVELLVRRYGEDRAATVRAMQEAIKRQYEASFVEFNGMTVMVSPERISEAA